MRRFKSLLLLLTFGIISNAAFSKANFNTFASGAQCKAYDRITGNFFLGFNQNVAGDQNALREFYNILSPAYVEFGDSHGVVINDIALIRENGISSAATKIAAALPVGTLANRLAIYSLTGLATVTSAILNLSDQATAAARIGKIASGYCTAQNAAYAFARVSADVNLNNEGNNGSLDGVACLKFTPAGAQPNAYINTVVLKTGATPVFKRLPNGSVDGNLFNNVPQTVNDMWWDNDLQLLYIGNLTQILNPNSASLNPFNIGFSIVKGNVDAGQLALNRVLPTAPEILPQRLGVASSQIIFTGVVPQGQATVTINLRKLRTMKTSKGNYYLIINRGIDITGGGIPATIENNKVYALRISAVNNQPAGTTKGDIIAHNGNALLDGFVKANLGSDVQLNIGGTDGLPFSPNLSGGLRDLDVVGDTVYASVDVDRDANNDPGIYASTAMFDADGTIYAWTKWERVFPASNDNLIDSTEFFAIDAKNNQIWQNYYANVAAANIPAGVAISTINTTNFTANYLPAVLSTNFSNGCFSSLDLPASTPGINSFVGGAPGNGNNSFTLFGGFEQVAFAQTTKNDGFGNRVINLDYTPAANYKLTTLKGAGTIRALGYSCVALEDYVGNLNPVTYGYFLAGSDIGLWAYTDANKQGFNVNTDNNRNAGLQNLSLAPFDVGSNFTWKKFMSSKITGAVTTIECTGAFMYVVEQNITRTDAMISKLWRIEIDNNMSLMEQDDHTVVIAQSGENLPVNTLITGFKFTKTALGNYTGVLSTTAGIYNSSVNIDGFNPANNEWLKIGVDVGNSYNSDSAYDAIYAPKNYLINGQSNSSIYGIVQVDSSDNKKYYQNGKINITSLTTNSDYTNADMASGTALPYVDRLTSFWTDGARRFYSRYQLSEYSDPASFNPIRSLPYKAAEWGMTAEASFDALKGIPRVYWISNISGLGIILAGTDTGVIALEN